MIKKKFAKALALFMPLTLLTACFPSGDELLIDQNNSEISQQIGDIAQDNENFEIDVPTVENVAEVPKINVKIMEWDEDKLKDLFLKDKTNLEYEEHPANYCQNELLHLYLEKDEEGEKYWFSYEPGYLTSRNWSNTFGYGTLLSYLNDGYLDDIFTDDDLSLLSKEDAIKRCTDLMQSAGIKNYSEPTVYAITVDKANFFWQKELYTDYEEYKDWTSAEEEVYAVRFPIKYNDINVTTDTQNYVDSYGQVGYFVGSYIDFIVTKNSIYSMNGANIFSPEYETGDMVQIKCSGENALKIASEHYSNASVGNIRYKIYDCQLVYVPHEQYDEKNFTLVPMWEIKAARYGDYYTVGILESLFIDAQTSKVIIW